MNEYMTGLRGAPATMERQLHNYTNSSEDDGADAPPWRGRHGARSSTRPKFCNTLQNTRRRIGIRLSIGRGQHSGPHSGFRGCAAYGEADSDPPPRRANRISAGRFAGRWTWRRIGIRLSIEYMTGLRGAPATMERQLHNYTNRSEDDGADAPRWPVIYSPKVLRYLAWRCGRWDGKK